MFSKKRSVLFIAIAIAAVLAITSVAYAAHVTINTDDGAIDGAWVNVPLSINDGADAAANYDIVEAWVGNEADNSAFYFRVNLAGTGQLPDDYSTLEARLDCNQDGDFTDAGDVIVYYALDAFLPDGEESVECQGTDYIDCDYAPEPNNSDTNPISFGEEIAGSPYNYEWRADVNNGDTDWSACLGTFNVQFASVDNTGAVQDITVWRAYSAPNAVTLTRFTVQNQIVPVAAIVLGTAAVGGLLVIRQRKVQ
jgi:hypothetical protein